MDVLSDVLLSVRLTGAVFFDVEARSPFAAETPGGETDRQPGDGGRRSRHRFSYRDGRLVLG